VWGVMAARPRTPALPQRTLDLLALVAGADLGRVLDDVVRAAADLCEARWGALGVPDGRGGFARFHTVGVSDALARRIGALPRTHGLLGLVLEDGKPIIVEDITKHPRFGWFPEHHPPMRDLLGVPVVHRGEILGNLFLSGSRHGAFTEEDLRATTQLASVAGIAIATATLSSRAQELAMLEERNRMARELHDAASQRLFSLVYEAHTASLRVRDEEAAAALRRIEDGAAGALAELRALVHALRPKSLETDGLAATLAAHAQALARLHEADVVAEADAAVRLDPEEELAVLRIGQEALHNAVRHAPGAHVRLQLRRQGAATVLDICDDGPGFDPDGLPPTSRSLGLSTMRERADAVGGRLEIMSAPGAGTEVRLTLPGRRRRGGAST
jgi:signal transduction histidine kinase